MTSYRFSAGIWMFGRFVDRFATDGYGPEVSMPEAIRSAGEVEGMTALDLNYPFWGPSVPVADIRDALEGAGLRAQAITPDIYSREFRAGAFTNPDPKVRQRALDVIARATDVGLELGIDYMKIWPGQDGFDYPLQADPRRLWDLSVEGMRAAAGPHPALPFAIEYKPKEPRTHMLFSTAARTLLAIEDIGLENVGVLIDFGHSMYGGESPAAAVEVCVARDRLIDVDLNDNFRSWDDDMTVGSVHIVETLEFLLSLKRAGWDKPWKLDQFPFREDPVEAARSSIRMLTALLGVVERIDTPELAAARERQDALAAQRLLFDILFGEAAEGAMTLATSRALPIGRIPRTLAREERLRLLTEASRQVRLSVLEMVRAAGLGHIGGDFSATDIVVVLLLAVLDVDPAQPHWPERDRFVMSKGHSSASLYATLAACGFFAPALLDDYMKPLSPLNGHPDAKKVPGVEANTGPLGHGLPIAVGMAVAAQLDGSARRTVCLVGDGELQEGSNWEALMAGGHRGLGQLTVVVDRNGLQQGAATEDTSRLEPLGDKARAFGWAVAEVDGHDHAALLDLFEGLPAQAGKPTFVIAHTHKGFPISFMRDRVEWHHRVPSEEQVRAAIEELGWPS